ncbi:MAG: AsmA family protein [Rhodospirillales bacterium]|nr:AsmA family protein [Rhodospirillales bacterium]
MPARRPSRRARRPLWRLVAYVGLGLVAALVIAVVAAVQLIDPNAYKPQILAAVEHATGRTLTLAGPIRIVSYTVPTIAVTDVAFANMKDGTRPQMLTVRSIEADIGLGALLQGRVAITRLVLDRPDLLLETDKQGKANWQLAPAGPAKPAAARPAARAGARPAFSVQTLHVKDAKITWHDGRSGRTTTVLVPRLSLTASSLTSSVMVDAEATAANHSLQLTGRIGPLERLFGGRGAPWPLDLRATTHGAEIQVSGSLADPHTLAGYALRLRADIVNMSDLAALSPVALPSLQDLTLNATVADQGGLVPSIQSLSLRLGRSDLSPLLPGVSISEANIDAPAPDKPIHVAIQGALAGAPLSVVANLGAPATLTGDITGKKIPFPVDVDVEAARATLTAKGAIADPAHLRGTDVALAARIPDLSALSALALTRLPALRDVTFAAHLQDAAVAGGARALAVHGLSLVSPQLALGGDLVVAAGARPAVTGSLAMSRLDLDRLMAILSAPVPGQATPPAPPPAPVRIFPTKPFVLAPLRLADLDLRLQGGNIVTSGGTIRAFATHATLKDGDLNLSDGVADLPGGHVTFVLGLDARAAVPKIALKLTGPSLATRPLLGFLGIAPLIDGTAQLHVDVAGSGVSPHAVAGTLGGTVGLAMAGGSFDGRMLGPALNTTLHLAAGQMAGNATPLRCLAVRLDIVHGVAKVAPLLIDSPAFAVAGGGNALLSDETLALLLRPDLRIAGGGMGVPVSVTGPILAPHASPDGGAAVAGLAAMATSPIGDVTGIAGTQGQTLFGANPAADPCPAALAAARFGLPGAAAPALKTGVMPGVLNGVTKGIGGTGQSVPAIGNGLGGAGQLLRQLVP